MRKKLDYACRIVLPQPMRKKAGLNSGDYVEISYIDDTKTILIECITEKCSICGSEKNLQYVNDIILCQCCVDKIKHS